MSDNLVKRAESWNRCYPGNLNIESLVNDMTARIRDLEAQLKTARDTVLIEAAEIVRHGCRACGGSGHADAETECQYCGEPISAILAKVKE